MTRNYPTPTLLIASRWCSASDWGRLPVVNPATGEPVGDLRVATRADLDEEPEAAGHLSLNGTQPCR